ncbi:SdpI family protein [Aurantiacibacter odishensis]|uniref:SdpI family protein n=1 Tax=Aurantiacibacter odishensis TaxID=1155476 RepID=UPI001F0B9A52|nr:SdpI family protein [Aurantiacibacter odishensis]
MLVFAFLTHNRLPEGAQLPIHWNAAGEADDWAPALIALLLPVGMLAFTTALFAILPSLEPLQKKLEASAPVLRAVWGGMILLSLVLAAIIGLPAWGVALSINALVLGMGFLLLLVGNALPKSRPGFFVGIRTPWAITDTDNWIATHRLGGKLMMAAGALNILAAVLQVQAEALAIILVASIAMATVIPVAYSWWFWRSRKAA